MRVVGVSRVLNEVDIVEPFLRHHAPLLDLHILLDNGSTDGTVDIVRALHGEGMALQLYQTVSPLFMEMAYNTGLYRLALGEGADWVLFLDADELVVLRGAARPAEVLAVVPESVAGLRVDAYRYARPRPAPGEHPFEALRTRAAAAEMPKIALRRMAAERVRIYAGNHFAFVDGAQEPGLPQDRMWLAHAPDRSPLQAARKVITGRLKATASGAASAAHFSTHRIDAFTALSTDPTAWLQRELEVVDPVDDHVAYGGGPLRYTRPPDDLARLISLFASQSEQLARTLGDVLDRKRLVRQDLQRRAETVTRLL